MVYSQDKQVLLSKANKDRILVETDGPVRFSRCFENKTAQIDFIPSIIFSVIAAAKDNIVIASMIGICGV